MGVSESSINNRSYTGVSDCYYSVFMAVACTFLYEVRLCECITCHLLIGNFGGADVILMVLPCVLAFLQLKRNELFPPRYKSLKRVSAPTQYWPTTAFFPPRLSTCNINHVPGGIAAFASGCHERSCLLYTRQQELE